MNLGEGSEHPARILCQGREEGVEKDAVGISSQEGSGSLQMSHLTSYPKADYFTLSTSCEQLCNHRDCL